MKTDSNDEIATTTESERKDKEMKTDSNDEIATTTESERKDKEMKTDSNDEIATTEEERAIDWLLEHVQGAIYYREQRAIRFPDDERNETSAEALGKLEIHIENGLPEDIRRGLVIAVDTPDTEDGDTLDTEDGDTLDGNIELFDLDDFNRALGRFGFDDPQADPAEFLSCFFAGLTDKAYEPRED